MTRVFRWIAIGIAVAAVIDPGVPMPRTERPAVRIVSPESRDVSAVAGALTRAGFVLDPAAQENAGVVHQHIELAILLHRRGHGSTPVRLAVHVEGDEPQDVESSFLGPARP